MKEEQNYINSDTRYLIQFLFSLWILYVGLGDLVQRYFLEVEGVVVESSTASNPRRATYYQVVGSDKIVRQYIAGPTDMSLSRDMPVGTRIKKIRHHLSWEKDGMRVNDFPLYGPLGMTTFGLILMYWSISQRRFRRTAKYKVPNQAL